MDFGNAVKRLHESDQGFRNNFDRRSLLPYALTETDPGKARRSHMADSRRSV